LADKLEKATIRVVVLRKFREVLVELVDSLSDEGDLNFRRAGVGRLVGAAAELGDGGGFAILNFSASDHVR
jgi:hypothetical protein